MRWVVELLPAAAEEIEQLPPGLRGRILRLIAMVEEYGLLALSSPDGRQVEGKLWEMRVIASDGIARGFYMALQGRRIVILHVFVKKSQAIPAWTLALARQRMKEVE